jgi:CelD/BcsL family acetyltransferase involved in cellulose biosynthesis
LWRALQGLFNSFDADAEIALSNPGEILLAHVLRDACARKIAAFDLGLGDARYKMTFCDEIETMADALSSPVWRGPPRSFFFLGRPRRENRHQAKSEPLEAGRTLAASS